MPHKSFSLEFAGYYREPNAGSLPSASGVYCVYACTYDPRDQTVSLRELMYIGESGDIRDRVANHDKHDAWKRRLRAGETLCFSAAAVSSSDRTRVEAALKQYIDRVGWGLVAGCLLVYLAIQIG